jgi:hypothetical protein
VVGLGHDREAVALDAVDEPHLPERLRPVQALGEDTRCERAQLIFTRRRGQGGVPHVIAQVETGIVDPLRPALAERDEPELLPEARHEVEARRDVLAELVVAGRGALEEGG